VNPKRIFFDICLALLLLVILAVPFGSINFTSVEVERAFQGEVLPSRIERTEDYDVKHTDDFMYLEVGETSPSWDFYGRH